MLFDDKTFDLSYDTGAETVKMHLWNLNYIIE